MAHHESFRQNSVRVIHNKLTLVLLGIQHQIVVIDGPTIIIQQLFGHFNVVFSTSRVGLPLFLTPRSFRISKPVSTG